jgi:hypothetical protein
MHPATRQAGVPYFFWVRSRPLAVHDVVVELVSGTVLRWALGGAACAALGCTAWWLVAGGVLGAATAGALSAVAGVVAAIAAVLPLVRKSKSADSNSREAPISAGVNAELRAVAPVLVRATIKPQKYDRLRPVRMSEQVALWGPIASGKTCFLTALSVAAAQTDPPWSLFGLTPPDSSFLTSCTADLIGRRQLPALTDSFGPHSFRGVLKGEVAVEIRRSVGRRFIRLPVRLDLSIHDFAGELFRNDYYQEFTNDDTLIDYLAACNGIVFFFDPLHADGNRESIFEYFQVVVNKLETRLRAGDGLDGSRLPHRVAVCIAKYDHPRILEIARNGGYLMTGENGDLVLPPRIADDRAEAFFNELSRRSPDGGAALFSHAVRTYFHPDRIRYFAISSLGFHLGPSGEFDWEDYYNIEAPETSKIRGNIYPMNVLEPLLWLGGSAKR